MTSKAVQSKYQTQRIGCYLCYGSGLPSLAGGMVGVGSVMGGSVGAGVGSGTKFV